MVKSLMAAAVAAGALALAACGQTTTVEAEPTPAGEPASAPSATDRDDGALENAGEAIDGAGDHVEESINDDNPNTNP